MGSTEIFLIYLEKSENLIGTGKWRPQLFLFVLYLQFASTVSCHFANYICSCYHS